MTSQTNAVVVDVNVWLDYLFGNRPGNKAACRFFTCAAQRGISLVIPPHSLSNLFYLVQSELKRANREDGKQTPQRAAETAKATAWSVVDFVMDMATVGPSDQADALIASKYRGVHGDYEDNLVIACTQRTKARLLVTNDEKLIMHSPVTAMRAEDAARILELE